jgi:SP family sugar:H+ symporter-like MFS transporter
MLGSWVSSHWGRRMCMFSMSIWACVAATIVITSKTRDQILVGRVMNYIYIGMELSVVPLFQGEIVPAQARGFVVGTYQISLFIGGLIMNCVARGTGGFAGREAYMIPFGLFYIVPTIVACLIWFVPESPRWLILRGRQEEGLAALRKFRAGKFSEEEIQIEFDKIVLGIHTEVEQGSFVDIFRSGVIKRTVVVIGANFFLQATGQIFTSIYGALFVKSLGTINPFSKCTLQRMDVEAMLTYNLQLLL